MSKSDECHIQVWLTKSPSCNPPCSFASPALMPMLEVQSHKMKEVRFWNHCLDKSCLLIKKAKQTFLVLKH